MPTPVTSAQMREAILDVLSGNIHPPHSLRFDTYGDLKIGVRESLAKSGILEPQFLYGPIADTALSVEEERIYKRCYDELVSEGKIITEHDSEHFSVDLLPEPFSRRWRFVRPLRGGGQGTTQVVRSLMSDVTGVLKIPRSMDKFATQRFQREVAVLSEINHAAVVRLLDSNLDPAKGALGYVTPMGAPMDAFWESKVPGLSPAQRYTEAYRIVRRIAEGLQGFHEKGGVHRDLKPENVIFIDDEPIIIDFGVALRPGDDRLSPVEGRPVANSFATPPSAHYGLHEGGPAWDCLGLAWIYGFLVGEGMRPKHFHWRFHQFVDEARTLRAKAVLAACSHETTVPADANGFIELMDRYQLKGIVASSVLERDADRFAGAVAAHAEAQAKRAVYLAERTELVEASIQMLEAPLTTLRVELNRVCVGDKDLPVDRNAYVSDVIETPVMSNRPMAPLLKQTFQQEHSASGTGECIFSCTCGTSMRNFEIVVFVGYVTDNIGDALPFRLFMRCSTVGGKPPFWPEALLDICKDGRYRDCETGLKLTSDEVVQLAYRWMTEPRFWDRIS